MIETRERLALINKVEEQDHFLIDICGGLREDMG